MNHHHPAMKHPAIGFTVGFATVWHEAADWGAKLLFAVLVTLLAHHADDFFTWLFRRGKK